MNRVSNMHPVAASNLQPPKLLQAKPREVSSGGAEMQRRCMDDCLIKPLNLSRLLETLDKWLSIPTEAMPAVETSGAIRGRLSQ
ncbi:hypothetical protein [Polaromonas sp.]|uniref:hypothetical protein n=1 Tax=Polaromonas sp. TaxID=1869339 RepID=UPI0018501DB1|nr:hypothetical protein [Polaromonas sp.]NMM06761.1 hypothetical protein [Polaromonas sp.]